MSEYIVPTHAGIGNSLNVTQSRYHVRADERIVCFDTTGAINPVTFVLPSGAFGMEYHFGNYVADYTDYQSGETPPRLVVETQQNEAIVGCPADVNGNSIGVAFSTYVQVWSSGVNNAVTLRYIGEYSGTPHWLLEEIITDQPIGVTVPSKNNINLSTTRDVY